MVDASPGTSLFTRPPTPPKENVEHSGKLPIDNTYQSTLRQQVLLATPDESPSSSSEYFNGSGGKVPKRVVFSPWTSYHKPLVPGKTTVLDGKLRPVPPSKECVPSHRSILKASTSNSNTSCDMPQQLVLDPNQTVTVMLQSVNQHLNSVSRDSRLDGYRTLFGCLSAYEEVPHTQSLSGNLAGVLECIRRDVTSMPPGTGTLDVEVASYALKLLASILYTPGLKNAVPHDFGNFIAEQAVSAMESQNTPKIILDHYMQLLAQQKLPQKIINSERANRILSALNGLEARVKGNRVVGLKLMIYQRLLVQAKSLMVPRAEDWLEFLIASMSSSIKDIRLRAIAFGTDAALALGTTTAVSQSCIDILDRETPSGPKVVDYLGARLLELLHVKNEGLHVPRIWTVIILFLRSRRRQIERWQHMKGWLGIMQRAFNSSDSKVRLQANIAWNRLVSATNLDTSTGAPFIKMLRQPVASQLERKANDSHMRHAKQVARSTYCNLLYHAFRPGATYEQLDLYWDAFVAHILSIRSSATKSDLEFACEVLAALFSSTQPRVWDQDRVHQLTPMKSEELPCLDPKWTRSRSAKIIRILEELHLQSTVAEAQDILATPFFKAWQSFVKALGDAASKEVKVSLETMTATANIMTMLHRYWTQSSNSSKETLPRLDDFVALISETVAKVGSRPFTEKRLFRSSCGSCFEAAETPTTRSARHCGNMKSPVTFALHTLVNATRVHELTSTYYEAVQTVLEVALRTANGRGTHLAIVWELAQDVISDHSGSGSNKLIFWECVAKQTARALSFPQVKAQDSDNPQYPGNDYREAVKLLELGIREFGYDIYPVWKVLSDAVIDRIQDEACHAGILLVYTEPLSKVVSEEEPQNISDNFLRCATYVLGHIRWPESWQALERVRKQLWGPGSIPRGPPPLDPFDHLYSMLEMLLTWTYPRLQSLSVDLVTQSVSGINSFLLSCPVSLRIFCLRRVQRGLGMWIEDKDAIFSCSGGAQGSNHLNTVVRAMKQIIMDTVNSIAKPESSLLASVSDLLVAGLRSRHEAIVNDFIILWNQTFAKAEALEYPAALHHVLRKIRSRVDIELPGFVDNEETEIMSSPFNFVESQDEDTVVEPRTALHSIPRSPGSEGTSNKSLSSSKHHPRATTRPPVAKEAFEGSKLTPKGRPRHDDSQIQFAAVDSSPLMASVHESQHLTDHQKEIREQQELGAAAMFPDIRSSPRRSRSAERLPDLVLHRKQAFSQPLDADAEPSPTFPPGDTIMNDFLGSSPTPRASRRSSVDCGMDKDPASSPPASPLANPTLRKVVGTRKPITERDFENITGTLDLPEGVPSAAPDLATTDTSLPNKQGVQMVSALDTTRALKQRTTELDNHVMSDSEEFVDAPGLPTEEKETDQITHSEMVIDAMMNVEHYTNAATEGPTTPCATAHHEDESADSANLASGDVTIVSDSFSGQAPFTPSQDEQVREQLFRDLEEASSQGDKKVSKRRPSMSSPSKVGKKRKIHPNNGIKRNIPLKLPTSSQNCEVVVEKRQPDGSYDDCIIVDDRPAAGQRRTSCPAIKQERTPSPTKEPQVWSARAAAPRKIPARRRARSMISHESLRSSIVENPGTPSARAGPVETSQRTTTEQHPRKRRRVEHQAEKEYPAEECRYQVEESKRLNSGHNQSHLEARTTPLERQAVLATADDDITSSQMEEIKDLLLKPCDPRPDAQAAGGPRPPISSSGGDTVPNTPHDDSQQVQDPVLAEPPARSPGQKILERFKHLVKDLGQVTFWPEEEREMVEVAVEVIKNVHEAGRKNGRRVQ